MDDNAERLRYTILIRNLQNQLAELTKENNELKERLETILAGAPTCVYCGETIKNNTGFEKNGVFTPVCSVCQARILVDGIRKNS